METNQQYFFCFIHKFLKSKKSELRNDKPSVMKKTCIDFGFMKQRNCRRSLPPQLLLSELGHCLYIDGAVSWGSRIYRLHLCREVRLPLPNDCPGYDSKQSDGEVPVMLKLWGMRSTHLLPSLPGPLCPGVVATDRVLSMGQRELNNVLMLNWMVGNRTVLTFKLCTYAKLNYLK